MKTVKKQVRREDFILAITTADEAVTKSFKDTKLGWYCSKFVEFNERLLKKHNKELTKLTRSLKQELSTCRITHAVEKDGKLLFDEKGNYCYDKSGEEAVLKKEDEINEKINELVDVFLEESVEVICITSEFATLPKELSFLQFRALNKFAFNNKSEHEEEITHEEEAK